MTSLPQYRSGLSEALAAPAAASDATVPGSAVAGPRSGRLENHASSTIRKAAPPFSTKRRIGKSPSNLSPAAFEASGVITPALLAKHHIPDILLSHGPLSLRHIMAYLTTTVPGFSGVPLPKQRRLVTSALEGNHNGVAFNAGIDGDILFEKVGVGKWQAKLREGATTLAPMRIPRSGSSSRHLGLRPEADSPTMEASDRGKAGTHWKRESGVFLQDEDVDNGEKIVVDDEDVQMVPLDFASSSDCITQETTTDPSGANDDSTDEEDWASIGAEGLRNPASIHSVGHNAYFTRRSGVLSNGSGLARSLPWEARISVSSHRRNLAEPKVPASTQRAREEQEAVEALVKLGSF